MQRNGLEIPLVDYEENNKSCLDPDNRTYLNNFVKFINAGEKWIYNLCS